MSDLDLVTAFAPAVRASRREVEEQVALLAKNPLVLALLDSVEALVMILNRERQILFANLRLAESLCATPETLRGLRPGEAIGCVVAWEGRAGCGTSQRCATCGAGRLLMAPLGERETATAECLLSVRGTSAPESHEYLARASRVAIGEVPLTVLSFRDISDAKRREALEQVFFHDVLNTVAGLRGYLELLPELGQPLPKYHDRILRLTRRLQQEVEDQRALLLAERGALPTSTRSVALATLLEDAGAVLEGIARPRAVELEQERPPARELVTDPALVQRVLVNMGKNAIEATPPRGVVRLFAETDPRGVALCVWNRGAIGPGVAQQIFKRAFSTKASQGRGLGTYSMRLFAERYLGGAVSFRSDEALGTVFRLQLPA